LSYPGVVHQRVPACDDL